MAAKEELTRGYAEALFVVATAEGALGVVEDELFAFSKAVEQQTALRDALVDASLPAENRKAVVRDLLGDRAHPLTGALIGFIVEAGRAKDLSAIVGAMTTMAAEQRHHEVAEVRTAVDLTQAQRERITAALAEATGMEIELKVVVDASLVGGIVARVGDEVFDGSIASRLAEAKQQLGS
ncbi:MAG: ATP synthase F1 subunit delta [Actinomycetota bacterium]